MIHYHGTPFSGTRQDTARFLLGRHGFVSFARPDDMPIVADACQTFALDNGAYSFWRKGGQLDYFKFLDWVEQWHRHPGFDWAIIPDVIGGSEKENDKLLEMWPENLKGVPVYHTDLPVSRLKKLADKYEIVALGSTDKYGRTNSGSWWVRMGEIMDAVCDEHGRPPCKLHGLRMLNPEVFTRIPLSSADSTNAAQNSSALKRFGIYPPPTAAQRGSVIANRIEKYSSAPVWIREPEQMQLGLTA